jgi:hypothetical protein
MGIQWMVRWWVLIHCQIMGTGLEVASNYKRETRTDTSFSFKIKN